MHAGAAVVFLAGLSLAAASGAAAPLSRRARVLRKGGRAALLSSGRMEPLANDTLPEVYFDHVEKEIDAHTTPAPPAPAPPAPASEKETAESPQIHPATPYWKVMKASQPFTATLGAAVLYEMSQDPIVNPPPTQLQTDATIAEQCPMLSFADKLLITAPHCSVNQGTWEETTGRNILRWDASGSSVQSIRLSMDSPTADPDASENGTKGFASIHHEQQMTKNTFEVRTCKGVPIWKIEEKLTRVQHLGFGDNTARPHDTAYDKVAYFAQYFINHLNGSVLAKTNFFRLDSRSVNLTSVASGQMLASAEKVGNWKRTGWRNCTHNKRAWQVTFPQNPRDADLAGTSQDLRVVSTAAILVMTLLDEARQPSNQIVPPYGMRSLWWLVLWAFIAGLLIVLVPCLIYMVLYRWTSLGERVRVCCLRCQYFFLPTRVYRKRQNVMHAAW